MPNQYTNISCISIHSELSQCRCICMVHVCKKTESTRNITACILWKHNLLKLASKSSKHNLSELFLKLPQNASQLGLLLIIPSSSHHENFKESPQPLSSALGSFYLFTKPFTRLRNIGNIFHLSVPLWLIMFLFNSMFTLVPFSANLLCRQACEYSQLYWVLQVQ